MAVSFPNSKFATPTGSTALATAFTTTGGNDILVCIENTGGGTTTISDGSANVYTKIGSNAALNDFGGPSELWVCQGALSRASATWTVTNAWVTAVIEVAGETGGYGTAATGSASPFRTIGGSPLTISVSIAATSTLFGYFCASFGTQTLSASTGSLIGSGSTGGGTAPRPAAIDNTGSGSTAVACATTSNSTSNSATVIAVEIKVTSGVAHIFTRRQRGWGY